MMRRLFPLLLALLLLAAAAAAMEDGPLIQDSAGVISPSTLSSARQLAEQLRKDSGIRLYVEFCHFLGGADVQAAAAARLKEVENSDDSLLLLAVVGEERYALAAGREADRKLNRDTRDNLLSSQFRVPFLDRDYDRALAQYLTGAEKLLMQGKGGAVTGSYFDHLEATKRPDSEVYRSITITQPGDSGEAPGAAREREAERDKGMSIFSIIAIGMVLSTLFGKKGKDRGCGCGPLGWIFSVFGLAKLFGWRK